MSIKLSNRVGGSSARNKIEDVALLQMAFLNLPEEYYKDIEALRYKGTINGKNTDHLLKSIVFFHLAAPQFKREKGDYLTNKSFNALRRALTKFGHNILYNQMYIQGDYFTLLNRQLNKKIRDELCAIPGSPIIFAKSKSFTSNSYPRLAMPVAQSNAFRRTATNIPLPLSRYSVGISFKGQFSVRLGVPRVEIADYRTGQLMRGKIPLTAQKAIKKLVDNPKWKVELPRRINDRRLVLLSEKKYAFLAGPWKVPKRGEAIIKSIGASSDPYLKKLLVCAVRLILSLEAENKGEKKRSLGGRRDLGLIIESIGVLDAVLKKKLVDLEKQRLGNNFDLTGLQQELKPLWLFADVSLKALIGGGIKIAIIADPNDRREYLFIQFSLGIGAGAKASVGFEPTEKSMDEFKTFSKRLEASAGVSMNIGPLKIEMAAKAEKPKSADIEIFNNLTVVDLQGGLDKILDTIRKQNRRRSKKDSKDAGLVFRILKIDVGVAEFEISIVNSLEFSLEAGAKVEQEFQWLFDIDTNLGDDFIYPVIEALAPTLAGVSGGTS